MAGAFFLARARSARPAAMLALRPQRKEKMARELARSIWPMMG